VERNEGLVLDDKDATAGKTRIHDVSSAQGIALAFEIDDVLMGAASETVGHRERSDRLRDFGRIALSAPAPKRNV
jgi:hypothetical protein